MRKLFLTSFEFMTGDLPVREQRLVVVSKNDIDAVTEHDIPEAANITNPRATFAASQKAQKWFSENYPESTLNVLQVHEAIE